jgi:N-acetylglucosamine-6-phosphate deacetylase
MVFIRDGKIRAVQPGTTATLPVGAEITDAQGMFVAPGLIDTHTHGGNGFDYMTCTAQELEQVLAWLPSTGVTSVLPTLSSSPFEPELEMVSRLAEACQRSSAGAVIAGLHLEGPFISLEKRGAQPKDAIRPPSLVEMRRLVEAGRGCVRLVTLAPELPGAIDLIRYLVGEGIVASAGHTSASYEEMLAAIELGLSRAAHLFNGMAASVKAKEEWRSRAETPEALQKWIQATERRLKLSKKN